MAKPTSSARAFFKAFLPAHLRSEFDAIARPSAKLSMPLAVALREATDVARFFDAFWSTKTESGRLVRPGLERAGPQLPGSIGDEIRLLIQGIQASPVKLPSTVDQEVDATTAKARALLRSVSATLTWGLADASVLKGLKSAGSRRDRSRGALIHDLAVCAGLARKHQKKLLAIPDFSVELITDIEAIVEALKRMSADRARTVASRARTLEPRNRLIEMLARRVTHVRAAARYVFRDHPDILVKVTSGYERQRRRSHRAAARLRSVDAAPGKTQR
ncbi:MAG: hypothetical protein HOW73_27690 [Polyangiaceae bacterium]|nr:hypothetical protein [Polyangiaceae bacterium]